VSLLLFCAVDVQIFKFSESKTEVVPESQFPVNEADIKEFDSDVKERSREANFEKRVWTRLVAALTQFKDKPRFAVVSFHYIHDERPQDKLVYITWSALCNSLIRLVVAEMLMNFRCFPVAGAPMLAA
jgi:hypothetical protein